ncbi:MAG: hypothetical protein AB7V26_04730 [Lysobacterales bacterium]
MPSRPPRTLLARLRASAHPAVFALLVFTLKIGAVVACATHDFADVGVGTVVSQVAVMKVLPAAGTEVDLTTTTLGHAATCTHCACYHAAAVVPVAYLFLAVTANALTVRTAGLLPSASPPLELRPPIV